MILPESTRRVAHVLRILSLIALAGCAVVAGLLVMALFSKRLVTWFDLTVVQETSNLVLVLIMLLTLAGLAANGAAALFAARLFGVYASGDPFGGAAARALRGIATALIAKAVLSLLEPTLTSLFHSIDAAPGARSVSIGVGNSQIGLLLAAGLIYVISVVMRQAADIARENREFI